MAGENTNETVYDLVGGSGSADMELVSDSLVVKAFSPRMSVERNAADDGVLVTVTDIRGTTSSVIKDGDQHIIAQQAAAEAAASADRAEQVASQLGYIEIAIVDGNLVYTRTENVGVDFEISDGDLIMEVD